MTLQNKSRMRFVLRAIVALAALILAEAPSLAQTSPTILSTVGYLNATPQTVHTSNSFNSSGGFTLVAFVSTHPSWNGLPVAINGLTDNAGNNWSILTGPTLFPGITGITLMSAVYYVNSPITSANHTVTVQLSNPAPLVFHVFAIANSDLSAPPIFSTISDPGAQNTSASVTTAPITVPGNSVLLSWVKNETGATATATNGYTLDATQSTSFLWAESQSPISPGSYSGSFQYDSAIGWQTAIVGLKPSAGPVASDQTILADQDTPVSIPLTATSPQGFPLTYTVVTPPLHGLLSGFGPALTYTPNSGYTGLDSFVFRANDGTSNSNTATVTISVRGLAPVINSTVGYLNATPLTVHTSTALNSLGSSTLVAFVSSHPTWNGAPVSLNGLSDNLGNTWNVLAGPTLFSDTSLTLMSAIYYVNSPITSANHTVTATLTNPAPLVLHVFAVSGADVTGPPIVSSITDPGTGNPSTTVMSNSITVPVNSLLLSWTKNESNATATAMNGYTLDPQSTSFLWAESQTPNSAGSYTSDFQYDSAIGWQTAIVGVKPRSPAPPIPTINSYPPNPTNQPTASFSFSDTQGSISFLCQIDNGGFAACSSPASYAGLTEGTHTFYVEAQDSSGNQSGAATFSWTIDLTPPPVPAVTASPANPTKQTSASFSFSDTEAGVSYQCQLDAGASTTCSSPASYSGLVQGSHSFSVAAVDAAGNQSSAAIVTWTINTTPPPTPVITSAPANPTKQTSASFSFSDTQAGVSYQCQLDTGASAPCSSPASYSGLAQGSHSFSVAAIDAAGNQSSTATFIWTINTTPPPIPVITSAPANPTRQTSASFSFSDTQAGVSYQCQLDSGASTTCSSPASYSGLIQGSHSFSVAAVDAAGNQSSAAIFTWTINTTPPPTPVITSAPANPTNQTSASFSFSDAQAGVGFQCQLDAAALGVCSSPKSYSNLSQGNHTFKVLAQDAVGNQSVATAFTWLIDTTNPPKPVLTSTPANPTNKTSASFSFKDTQAGVGFVCQLDNASLTACSSPVLYPGPLSQGKHTFLVRAKDAAGNLSGNVTFSWSIDLTAPPPPVITAAPTNPTIQTTAKFSFSDSAKGVTFLCQLDGTGFVACASPKTYSSLVKGTHTFSVKAQDTSGNQSTVRMFTWTIQ